MPASGFRLPILLLRQIKNEAGRTLSRRLFDPDDPPVDFQPVFTEKLDRIRQALMFMRKDALGKGILIIAFHNRDSLLADHRPTVKALIDEMHGAPGYFDTVLDCLTLGVQPGE